MSTKTGGSRAALAAGIALVAINLRPATASMGPVLARIQRGTGLPAAWAGALSMLPVLCFGLVAPLAIVLARRLGVNRSIAAAMCGLATGLTLRLVPGVFFLFLGTAVAGASIAVTNVLVLVLVRRDFARRTGVGMALYSTVLIGSAALAAATTVPLADALGGGWRAGLAVWAIPAALCAVVWVPALLRPSGAEMRPRSESGTAPAYPIRLLLRRPLMWYVTVFFGLQSASYYATLAWLPSIFRSGGASEGRAGVLLSVSVLAGMVASLTIPRIAARVRDQRLMVAGACGLVALAFLGILLAPMAAPYLWTVLLGLGQSSAFALSLMFMLLRAGSIKMTEGLSMVAQSVGYVLAAFAPLVVGGLHGLTRSWVLPVVFLLALLGPQLLCGLAAGRDIQLTGPIEADLGPAGVSPSRS